MRAIEGRAFTWRGARATTRTTDIALRTVTARAAQKETLVLQKEVLVGENNLRSVSFLAAAQRAARAVAQVVVPGFGVGTGFMVSPNCLLTNNHVLPTAAHAGRGQARFNYELDYEGRLLPSYFYRLLPDMLYVTNEALDYTLVAVEQDPGLRFGTLSLTRSSPLEGERVNIIQHPMGGPKQVALVDNELVYVDDGIAQYLTDTMPGSSGSPVFNDDWVVVALHNSGGWVPEPSTQSTHFRNQGIRVSAILADLSAKGVA